MIVVDIQTVLLYIRYMRGRIQTERGKHMKVTVFRTAMIGGGLSYDVYVRVQDVANYDASRYTTIHRDSGKYVDFVDATLPESHFSMPLGWDKYHAFLEHQRAARRTMLTLAEKAFPELSKIRPAEDSLPLLWACGLLPEEASAVKTVSV
jgi:hypothetical protein